jgi:oligosaccharyltransferase complex subunit beta
VLRGNPSTYSANPNKAIDSLDFGGEKTLLVSAIQARNNARIIVSGSLEMFSNVYFRSKDSSTGSLVGNEIFCAELSKWAFAERGVLRFSDIRHHTSDGSPPDIILHEKDRPDLPHTLFPDPELTRNSLVYRIKDEIMYSMLVEEFADGSWRPFYATDMQMVCVHDIPHLSEIQFISPMHVCHS